MLKIAHDTIATSLENNLFAKRKSGYIVIAPIKA